MVERVAARVDADLSLEFLAAEVNDDSCFESCRNKVDVKSNCSCNQTTAAEDQALIKQLLELDDVNSHPLKPR
jgi:hypothetical protein